MFTGLIEETGILKSVIRHGDSMKAEFSASLVLEGIKAGSSIAVNGICQTVIAMTEKGFSTEISSATLAKTTMAALKPGDRINLERPVKLGDRLEGHIVQGHVNGRGKVRYFSKDRDMVCMAFKLPHSLMNYIIPEGSIAIDGISLTVSSICRARGEITVHIIPHTLRNTTLCDRKPGDEVNIETDFFGRYAESLLFHGNKSWTDNLENWGYTE